MNEQDKHAHNVKQSIDDIIGVDTVLKPKKKTDDDLQREKFVKIITMLQEAEVRGVLAEKELKIDFSSYDEIFYFIIDSLFELQFGKEAAEIIFFYLYERMDPDGGINELIDEEGMVVPLQNPHDLYRLVKLSQERSGKPKKK